MAQHGRSNTSRPESAVYLHLKDKERSFEDNDVHILDRGDRWYKRGVSEVIHLQVETSPLDTICLQFSMLPFEYQDHFTYTRKVTVDNPL